MRDIAARDRQEVVSRVVLIEVTLMGGCQWGELPVPTLVAFVSVRGVNEEMPLEMGEHHDGWVLPTIGWGSVTRAEIENGAKGFPWWCWPSPLYPPEPGSTSSQPERKFDLSADGGQKAVCYPAIGSPPWTISSARPWPL